MSFAMSANVSALEHRRVVLRSGELHLPPEIDPGERLVRVGRPQLLLRSGRRLEGHVVVAIRLIGRRLHRCEGEVGARVRRVVERQGGDVPVAHSRVDLPGLTAERPELGKRHIHGPSFGGTDGAELGADIEQIRFPSAVSLASVIVSGAATIPLLGASARLLSGTDASLLVTVAAIGVPAAGDISDAPVDPPRPPAQTATSTATTTTAMTMDPSPRRRFLRRRAARAAARCLGCLSFG